MTRSIAAIFDVDGTLFRSPSTERRLVKYLRRRGRFPVTALLNFLWGALVLSPKGISTVLKGNKYYLRGWSVKDTREVLEEFFGSVIVPLLDNTVTDRLRWHQRQGHLVFLLSGMPTFILRQYARHLGVEQWCGSDVVERDGSFLGPLENEHPYGEEKGEVVLRFAQENGVDLEASYGYGDHYTDRHFMRLLGHPVAVNPSGEFERLAASRGWKVVRY